MIIVKTILTVIAVIGGIYLIWNWFNNILFPKIVEKNTVEIERNPKWIISKIESYGFNDIDFLLVESKWGMLPRFQEAKKDERYELLLPNDISTKCTDDIVRLALVGKIKLKYGLWFPDKPLHWLSILCYMLDGGDVKEEINN